MSFPFLACATVTLISALVSLGYAVAATRSTSGEALTMAHYALARSVALAGIAGLAAFSGDAGWLVAAAVAMIVTQALDGVIGLLIHDRIKTFGPFGTAFGNLAVLLWYRSS